MAVSATRLGDLIAGFGWKRVDVDSNHKMLGLVNVLQDLNQAGVAVRSIRLDHDGICSTKSDTSGLIVFASASNPLDVFSCASKRRPYHSLVIGTKITDSSK